MASCSNDLRERVAAAVDHGEGSQREIVRRFRVSLSFIVRLLERRRDAGTLAPKPHSGGPNPALSPRDQQRLRELIKEQSDPTLDQLKQQAGFTCTLTTIWPASAWLDLQEEDPARQRAEPAGRARETTAIPKEGAANRAKTAGFCG